MSPLARCWLPWLWALVLAVGGCQCDEGRGVGGARGDFQAREARVDFGRVLEGHPVRREVVVVGTGRAPVSVGASTAAPFALGASRVEVAAGGTAALEVVFTAGDGPSEGTLVLEGAGRTVEVALRGEGVRPLECKASGPCRQARFELEPGACVESPAPDGTACIPASRCEERGRCEGGACVGQPRGCDDDNPCTHDACSAAVGCVTSRVACPRPANPCRAGVCTLEAGCTEVDVPDKTPCGPGDCVSMQLCVSGACRTLATPEGFPCAPPTPCQEGGKCLSQKCVRPDAGELVAEYSQALGGLPVVADGGPALLSHRGALYTSVCGGDGGCRLVSLTEEGVVRFEAPWPEDGGARVLHAASDAGVVVHQPGALEAYTLHPPGARRWRLPLEALAPEGTAVEALEPGPGRVGALGDEVLALLSWGGVGAGGTGTLAVLAEEDGGVRVRHAEALQGFGGPAWLALDGEGRVFAHAADGPLVHGARGADGGFSNGVLRERVEGGAALAASGGWVLAGASTFVEATGGDGGTVRWESGRTPLESPVLLRDGTAYVFVRVCPRVDGVPCAPDEERLRLRVLEARAGTMRWDVAVLPLNVPGALKGAGLLAPGLVGTLTESELLDGPLAHLQLFAQGQRLALCPLEGRPRVAGALFSEDFLYALVRREGTWRLEAFRLRP